MSMYPWWLIALTIATCDTDDDVEFRKMYRFFPRLFNIILNDLVGPTRLLLHYYLTIIPLVYDVVKQGWVNQRVF